MAKMILDSVPQTIEECPGRLGIKTGSRAGQFVCYFTGKECNCCGAKFSECPAYTVQEKQDKDKLIVVAILGVKEMPNSIQVQLTAKVANYLDGVFDNSVKHLITYDNTKSGVDFKTLNTDKIEPEEVEKLIESLKEGVKKL